MKQHQVKWKLLDHPADIRIEFYGENLEDLFRSAAEGLTWLLTGAGRYSGLEVEKKFNSKSDSFENLLVDWLRELLFQFASEGFVYGHSTVTVSKDISFESTIVGSVVDRSLQFKDGLEIKGVTYHELLLEKTVSGYVARVVFDI